MTEDELKAAIEKVESELSEQDEAAHTELQKAIEILKQLKENSDGTPAASRAAGALPILENSTPPTASGSAPFFDADASTLNEPAPALTPLPTY